MSQSTSPQTVCTIALQHFDITWRRQWQVIVRGFISIRTSSSVHGIQDVQDAGEGFKRLKLVIRAVVCNLVRHPINPRSFQWLSCSMPDTSIIPSTTCQCTRKRKTKALRNCAGEKKKGHKQVKMRIQMLYLGKHLTWVPSLLQRAAVHLDLKWKGKRKDCSFPRTQTFTTSRSDNVPRGGWRKAKTARI